MIPVQNPNFITEMQSGNHNFLIRAIITLVDGTVLPVFTNEKLLSMSLEDAIGDDSKFTVLGSAVINQLILEINNWNGEFDVYNFTNARIEISVGLSWIENEQEVTEYVDRGIYTVTNALKKGLGITLTCLDNMSKLDRDFELTYSVIDNFTGDGSTTQFQLTSSLLSISSITIDDVESVDYEINGNYILFLSAPANGSVIVVKYFSGIVFPTTVGSLIYYCVERCGVSLANSIIPYSTTEIMSTPVDIGTYRNAISYAAQIIGCYAHINTEGELEFKWFDTTVGNQVYIDEVASIIPTTEDITITGVVFYIINEENEKFEYTTGTDGFRISLAGNPFITATNAQTIVDRILTVVSGFTYRPLTCTHLSNPLIEAGDMAQVCYNAQDDHHLIAVTRTVFSVGRYQQTVCGSESVEVNRAALYTDAKRAYETATTARKVATNYLSADSTGIMVADLADGVQAPGTATGRNVKIDNDSVDIRDGQNVLASFGENVVVGNLDGVGGIRINSGAIEFVKDGRELFGGIYTGVGTAIYPYETSELYGSIVRNGSVSFNIIDESILSTQYPNELKILFIFEYLGYHIDIIPSTPTSAVKLDNSTVEVPYTITSVGTSSITISVLAVNRDDHSVVRGIIEFNGTITATTAERTIAMTCSITPMDNPWADFVRHMHNISYITVTEAGYRTSEAIPYYVFGNLNPASSTPGKFSFLVGSDVASNVDYGIAIGESVQAYKQPPDVITTDTKATINAALGKFNDYLVSIATFGSTEYPLVLGNGEDDINRSNAFMFSSDGNLFFALDDTADPATRDGKLYTALTTVGWTGSDVNPGGMIDSKELFTNILTSLNNKVNKSGDTMTGVLTMSAESGDMLTYNSTGYSGKIGESIPQTDVNLGGYEWTDKNGNLIGYDRIRRGSTDTLYRRLSLRRPNASGTYIEHGFYMGINSSGNQTVVFINDASRDAFLTGLNLNELIKTKVYTYGYSLNAGATLNITGTNFGVSTPSGYTVLGIRRYSAGNWRIAVTGIATTATGSSALMVLANHTSGNASGLTATIEIIYIKTGFITVNATS